MKNKSQAFSRTDLLACLFLLGLIFTMAVSLFASTKSDSQRVVCFNNLRQIGRAFQVWANDHDDVIPWRVSVAEGGTRGHTLAGNAWFQFLWISNQLGSPKILVCPADSSTQRIASEWGNNPAGGFLHSSYRANALSYPVFLHGLPNAPGSWLAGDRNFRADVNCCQTCFVGVHTAFGLYWPTIAGWTNAVHGFAGHLLFMDGSVRFTTTSDLQQAIVETLGVDSGSLHGLPAR